MVRLISVALFVLSMFATQAFAQQIELSVDRNELARGETLTLTIRVYDQRQGIQLDLTPLTQDFDVLGTRTSSQMPLCSIEIPDVTAGETITAS